ncbi:MAG: hypothetical protein H0W78_00845 [Planctomycetes bacterium]|nr:hypothetical protein [Planctomycetota bacterium]
MAPTRNRGFAAMDQERQRQIASLGGRAAHQSGNAHEFDSQEAREAGRRGGQAVSRDRQHMAEIGARGGQHRRSLARRADERAEPAIRVPSQRDDDEGRRGSTSLAPAQDEQGRSESGSRDHTDEDADGVGLGGNARNRDHDEEGSGSQEGHDSQERNSRSRRDEDDQDADAQDAERADYGRYVEREDRERLAAQDYSSGRQPGSKTEEEEHENHADGNRGRE